MKTGLIQKIEDANLRLNESFATRIIRRPDVTIFLNEEIPDDPYLNLATKISDPENVESFVAEVSETFESRGIASSFYLSSYTSSKVKSFLLAQGYGEFANDSWMFWDLNKESFSELIEGLEIKRVETEQELDDFTKVFVEVYSKGEPDDPYQGLSPLYDKFLRKRFYQEGKDSEAEYYNAYWHGKAVGTGSLLHDGEIGGMFSLAVLPEFRKLGIGKALQARRVERARELDLQYLYLITEAGSRNEKIFAKAGFRTEFGNLELVKRI